MRGNDDESRLRASWKIVRLGGELRDGCRRHDMEATWLQRGKCDDLFARCGWMINKLIVVIMAIVHRAASFWNPNTKVGSNLIRLYFVQVHSYCRTVDMHALTIQSDTIGDAHLLVCHSWSHDTTPAQVISEKSFHALTARPTLCACST